MTEIYRPVEELRSGFDVLNPRFQQLVDTSTPVERVWNGAIWGEGTTYMPDMDAVVFSDIPNNRLMLYSLKDGSCSTFRQPSEFINGNTTDLEGRLVSCEQGRRCISRTEKDGSVTVLAERYNGKRLNSPNDVVVKSDGSIWFTDPPYGIIDPTQGHPAESELGLNYLFVLDPATGVLEIASDAMDRPNGLAFSPDEKVLYVSDTGKPGNVMVFDVLEGRRLANPREFARPRPGKADGMRVDAEGNLFSSAWDGIQVFSSEGELLGKIQVPEQRTANCTFAGSNGEWLFIISTHSLYRVRLNAR